MLILLQGSSKVAQGALVALAMKKNKTWRQSTLPEMAEAAAQATFGLSDDPSIIAIILAECVKSLEEEGHHIILSADTDDELVPLLKEELGKACRTVFFGKEADAEGEFDLIIESKGRTAADAYKALKTVIDDIEGK